MLFSPDFDNLDYSAYHVEMDGSILGNWYVTGSYGNHASPETIDDDDAYYIYTSGVVVLDDYTSNSYGRISPWLNNNNGAIIVLTDGGVLDSTSSVDFSYGRMQLSGHTLYYFLVGWFKRCG